MKSFIKSAITTLVCAALAYLVIFVTFKLNPNIKYDEVSYDLISSMLCIIIGIFVYINDSFNDFKSIVSSELISFNKNLSNQLEAEASIMKIPFQGSQSHNYIKSLLDLHKKIDSIGNSTEASNFALIILATRTSALKDFFNQSNGGIYKMTDTVNLYTVLSNSAKAITIVEPKCLADYTNNYSESYIEFIDEHLKKCKRIKSKKYVFLNNFTANNTSKWLTGNGFKLKTIEQVGIQDAEAGKWSKYSHLLFEYDGFYISCSVLPHLFIAGTSQTETENQNYRSAEYFYLAFRVFNLDDIVSNGHNWFKKLILYHKN